MTAKNYNFNNTKHTIYVNHNLSISLHQFSAHFRS
jgi:hypothetical protein